MVVVGVTVGLEATDTKPAGIEVQLYVLPATGVAPIWVPALRQTLRFAPATAAGNGLTVTTTLWLLVQVVAVKVSVSMYVVVVVGVTVGLEAVEVNPGGTEVQL